MAEPLPPYDTSVYPGIWECPDGAVDPRHLYWLADVLAAGLFRRVAPVARLRATGVATATRFLGSIPMLLRTSSP
jgi:hypothetical protein